MDIITKVLGTVRHAAGACGEGEHVGRLLELPLWLVDEATRELRKWFFRMRDEGSSMDKGVLFSYVRDGLRLEPWHLRQLFTRLTEGLVLSLLDGVRGCWVERPGGSSCSERPSLHRLFGNGSDRLASSALSLVLRRLPHRPASRPIFQGATKGLQWVRVVEGSWRVLEAGVWSAERVLWRARGCRGLCRSVNRSWLLLLLRVFLAQRTLLLEFCVAEIKVIQRFWSRVCERSWRGKSKSVVSWNS